MARDRGDSTKARSNRETTKVELVTEREPINRTSSIGLGLLASLAVGFGPLTDALMGRGPFEAALGRFVACVVFCVVAASLLGRLLDGAPKPESPEEMAEEGAETPPATSEAGVGTSPSPTS